MMSRTSKGTESRETSQLRSLGMGRNDRKFKESVTNRTEVVVGAGIQTCRIVEKKEN